MTDPDGTVALDAGVTVPTANPTPVIAVVAAVWVVPTTLGTATGAGPVETTRSTVEPWKSIVPPAGLWLITDPDGTVASNVGFTVPSNNPALMMGVVGAICGAWPTWGRTTAAGPIETTRSIAVVGATCAPALGFWLMTDPDGTLPLDAVLTVPTVNPAPVSVLVAGTC